ncbi:lasso peptide biosynthesis B2 protein [Actinomadura scrupuli]|uniref:lasso peptide biosynthesis B2 protein n=1 Tax=Actinomadura scrupuli TaxID=559629 RepID=UPI003D9686BC
MTTPSALHRPTDISRSHRLAARVAVAAAFLLARLPPRRIRAVCALLSRGAAPATYAEAKAARDAVLAVSLTCLGTHGCLPRSLATTLLCRMAGVWPTWCVGARMMPPFGAHAWVEADGRLVDEQGPEGYFSPLMSVPPRRGR